jgi:hypothetical protein
MNSGRRLLKVILAYAAASLVAGAILAVALVYRPGAPLGQVDVDFVEIAALFLSVVSGFVALLALIPTLAVGIYAERNGIRSPVFYAVAGAGIGLCALGLYALVLVLGAGGGFGDTFPSDDAATAFFVFLGAALVAVVLAGIAGGLTYWAIAGRTTRAHRALSPAG